MLSLKGRQSVKPLERAFSISFFCCVVWALQLIFTSISTSRPAYGNDLAAFYKRFQDASPPKEAVVFSFIVYGNDTAHETAILMKSALMYTSSPIDFHLIADPSSQEYLEGVFALVTRPVHNIRVFFYPLSNKAMEKRLDRTGQGRADKPLYGAMRSNHKAQYSGLMKMFIHEILPDTVERSIFIDSDSIFIADPTVMWKTFETWPESAGLAIPTHENSERPVADKNWGGASRICTCVLMYNLQKMRELHYMHSSILPASDSTYSPAPAAFRAMWGEPREETNGFYKHVGLGDMGYMYAIQEYLPKFHVHLPLSWEVTYCVWETYHVGMVGSDEMTAQEQMDTQDWLNMTPDEHNLITPGLVHFNCLKAARYYEDAVFQDPKDWRNQRFGDAVRYHLKYKWIWLNKGDGSATTQIHTATDLRFYDEKLANRPKPDGY